MNTRNRSFENVAKVRHLGATVIVQKYTQEEIESRLSMGNAFCHLVQNSIPSHLPSKKAIQ
jgi:hypothetical protein